ncbi:ANTAR domain-containing protein [Streptomyces sp. NPDC050095]|uniref:ANTAR domain-containing protein n=1 Tax=unclassified Streptomyces TaxID=2593676 RepID=UPI003417C746
MHQSATSCGGQRLLKVAATDAALITEIRELRLENEQLGKALSSRAVIDQARGMIMALAPCSSEKAWGVLVDVSQHCNIKVRDVAAALVATTQNERLPAQLRRELRRALKCLHSR